MITKRVMMMMSGEIILKKRKKTMKIKHDIAVFLLTFQRFRV